MEDKILKYLATIQDAVTSTQEKVDSMEKKVDNMQKVMINHQDQVANQFARVHQRLDNVENKLINVEAKALNTQIALIDVKYKADIIAKRHAALSDKLSIFDQLIQQFVSQSDHELLQSVVKSHSREINSLKAVNL